MTMKSPDRELQLKKRKNKKIIPKAGKADIIQIF